jgi:hypothetical protein
VALCLAVAIVSNWNRDAAALLALMIPMGLLDASPTICGGYIVAGTLPSQVQLDVSGVVEFPAVNCGACVAEVNDSFVLDPHPSLACTYTSSDVGIFCYGDIDAFYQDQFRIRIYNTSNEIRWAKAYPGGTPFDASANISAIPYVSQTTNGTCDGSSSSVNMTAIP